MSKRRIIIATPLKGDIPKSYFFGSLQLAAGQLPNVKLDWMVLDGPSIQVARNELAHHALEQKFDELIFWDKDVLAEQDNQNLTSGALVRLISHEDKPMVCGLYANRSLETHWHTQTIPGEEADKDGLQKVKRCAIGFSKIHTDVFRKLAKDNPDRKHLLIDPNNPPRSLTEFFPMGIDGKNTPAYRIKQIKEFIAKASEPDAKLTADSILARIKRELEVEYDEPNMFLGEDYWFCDMVRASGFDILMDTFLVLGHKASVTLPIPTAKLVDMLSEEWRQDEIIELKKEILKNRASQGDSNAAIADAIAAGGQS